MPSKFRLKSYTAETYYHIYNRGIDHREIFIVEEDYQKFLSILEQYLRPPSVSIKQGFKPAKPSITKYQQQMNLADSVQLKSYCLMPNHFHLLIWQTEADAITKLMRRVCTQYVMYFNHKYHRQGTLFENVYRAIQLPDQKNALDLSIFIHLNPTSKKVRRFGLVETSIAFSAGQYPYSSYRYYLKLDPSEWIHPRDLLQNLSGAEYQKMVEDSVGKTSASLQGFLVDE